MRNACGLSLLLIAGLLSPVFAQSAYVGVRLPQEEILQRYGLTRAWWGQSSTNSTRDKLMHITVDETNLYTQSSSGIITCFDSETGKRLWATLVGGSDRASYPASSNEDLLLVVNGTSLFAVQKADGQIRWDLQLPGQPASSPVADERYMYVGFLDGSLYCFDIKLINQYDKEGKLRQWSFQTVNWRYKTSKPIVTPAVPNGILVAFASQNGSLYSVSANERTLKFQFETDAPLTAPMVHYKKWLLLASEDFNFYQVNIENGSSGWQFSAGLPIRRAPVIVGDNVYLMPERGGMYNISAQTGMKIWWQPRVEKLLAVSPTQIYATDRINNLVILDRSSGGMRGALRLERFTVHLSNDRSDRIYVATSGGLVTCLREANRDFPIFHLHPEKLPILPELVPEGEAEEMEDGSMESPADGEGENMDGEKPEGEMPEGEGTEDATPEAGE